MEFDDLQNLPGAGTNAEEGSSVEPAHPVGAFSPNPVRTRSEPIRITVKVRDTRTFVVRDALVFIRSTPVVTQTPPETKTGQDGTIAFTVQPETDFPIRNGYSVQFFVRARKEGDRPLAGIAGFRLVQVATAR